MTDNNIKLILLDFDGTLVDTREAHFLAYKETLANEGIELDYDKYVNEYFGVRCAEFMNLLGFSSHEDVERIRCNKIEVYPNYFDSVKLNQPLWDFCQSFRAQGVKVWIVSTGSRPNIQNVINHLGLQNGIDGLIAGGEIEKTKPHPDPFLKAMEIEGVTAAQTLIFEDSRVGLEAASRTGAAYFKVAL